MTTKCRVSFQFLLLVIVLPASILVACAGDARSRADLELEETIGAPLNTCLLMFTDKHTYRFGEAVVFWVDNGCESTLWFQNQSLGLVAYRYDEHVGRWTPTKLGFLIGNPRVTEVPPGPATKPEYTFETLFMDQALLGQEVRLVVVGQVKDASGNLGPVYGAYRDIIVVAP